METLLKNLKTATFESMERMFFLLPDPEEETNSTVSEGATVYIGVMGEPACLLSFTVDKILGERMVRDLLGESRIDHGMIAKCLQETANVIAGRFILLFDNGGGWNPTLPSDDRNAIFPGRSFTDADELAVSFDGCGMRIAVATVTAG